MKDEVFRKAAIEKLSSPEQLDELIRIAAPRTWMALAAILVLALAAGVWSVVGRIPTSVSGTGVLIRAGGVYNVLATSSGRVQQLMVAEDATVARDQVVAVVEQPELRERLRAAEQTLARARTDLADLVNRRERALRFDREQRGRSRASLDAQAKQADRDLAFLASELAINQDLEKRGLVTRQATIDVERQIEQTRTLAASLRNQVQQSLADDRLARDRVEEELTAAREQLADREREVTRLRGDLEGTLGVRSFYAGRVLGIKVDPGSLVTVGTPLLSLEVQNNELEGVVFVDATRAKEVVPGMRVELTPSDVRREEYGFMIGVVTHVSEYPTTFEEEMRLLNNEPLVRAMQGDGPDIQLNVRLERDRATRSGFAWSSRKGPPVVPSSGTICAVDIVTRSEAPIRLVFPAIRRTLGL